MNKNEIMETSTMRVKTHNTKQFTLKLYLHRRRRPIELEGLTQAQIDDFNTNATTKMFVKCGPVLIRSEAIDYAVIIEH